MTTIRLRFVDRFPDRHGKQRYYFRRGHGPRLALPGEPGSAEFMDAYKAALAGDIAAPPAEQHRGKPGTFARLTEDYFASPEYLGLASSSQRPYRLVIERWVRDEDLGHRMVKDLRREHLDRMLGRRAATPGAANDLLKKIRVLMGFAIAHRLRTDDPTLGIKRYADGAGHHTWTEDEIAQFEARWPLGTCERTAFALLLYTGQRRSDVVRMTWPSIVDGRIGVTPQKTERSSGKRLRIKVHHKLAAVLEAWPRKHVSILVTSFGKPFSAAGFGNWMADAIKATELPCGPEVARADRCVTHGLRKAAARRLAEVGCSAHEIMAITGHTSLAEVERYTRAAEQMRLGDAAIERLSANRNSQT
jgi:integrase